MRHNDKCWVHVITHSTVAKGEQMKVIYNEFNWTEETQTCRRLMLCMWSLLKTNTCSVQETVIWRKSSYRTYILLIFVWLYFIWSTIFKSNLFYFINNHCKETFFFTVTGVLGSRHYAGIVFSVQGLIYYTVVCDDNGELAYVPLWCHRMVYK